MPKVNLTKAYPHGGETYPAGAELSVSSSIANKIVGGGYGVFATNPEYIDEVVEKPRGRGRVHSQREAEPADDKDDGVSGGGDNSRPADR